MIGYFAQISFLGTFIELESELVYNIHKVLQL